jgi:hypothetical protein
MLFSGIPSVHVMTAETLATCKVQSGYRDKSSIALNLSVASWRCLRGALGVDYIEYALFQRTIKRMEGQVVLVVTLEPQLRRVVHWLQHLGIVVQSSG